MTSRYIFVLLGLLCLGPNVLAEERPIVDDAKKVEPLKVGNSLPALTLKNSQDEKVSLSSLHADGPAVDVKTMR